MPVNGQDVKFNYYTRAKFNALSSKDNNAIYYVEETNNTISMYIGNREITTGIDLHRVRIFNEQDELITTQIIHEGDKVLPLDKPGHLFEYGTRNEFDYDTIITEDIDLTYSIIPPRYVQTTTADFGSGTSADYIGTEEYIILPADKPSGYRIRNINVKGVATKGDHLTNTNNMFSGSSSLYLELDYLNTSNVTDMVSMFYNSQATTLDVSNFDTSNVTSMGSMFQGSQATTLDLSNFDTSNVTNMSQMFNNSQVTTLDLSNFDTSNVTTMSSMFRNSQATTLDVSNFDTSNVTSMSHMFRDSQATTLDLSSFDTSNVTYVTSMFNNSQATVGYARTQTDANRFNNSSDKPSTLTFVVTNLIYEYVEVEAGDYLEVGQMYAIVASEGGSAGYISGKVFFDYGTGITEYSLPYMNINGMAYLKLGVGEHSVYLNSPAAFVSEGNTVYVNTYTAITGANSTDVALQITYVNSDNVKFYKVVEK